MYKKIFTLLISISFLSHAEQQGNMLASAFSWAANHKLGFAGLGLIGAGLTAHKIIYAREKGKKNEFTKTEAEISEILTKKYPKYSKCETEQAWGNWKVTFTKLGYFTKNYSDIYTLSAPAIIKFDESRSVEGKTTIKVGYSPLNTTDKPVQVIKEHKLHSIGYADWIRNTCVGIGVVAGVKSFIFNK